LGKVEPIKRETSTARNRIVAAAVVLVAVGIILAVLIGDLIEDVILEGAPLNIPVLSDLFAYIAQGTLNVISSSGYLGVFFLMFLENTSLPIPSEVVLPFSGYLAAQGGMNLWLVIAISTVAGVLGAAVDYYIGFFLGLEGVKRAQYLPIQQKHLDSAAKWFNKYGSFAVFGSRLIPGFRTIISFPAGILHMSLAKFLSLTAIGCFLWDAILAYAGFYAGTHLQATISAVRYLSIIAIITVPVAVAVWYIVNRRRRKNNAAGKAASLATGTESSKFLS
jgi:membrane protein DedA with SNARE-associated domain